MIESNRVMLLENIIMTPNTTPYIFHGMGNDGDTLFDWLKFT